MNKILRIFTLIGVFSCVSSILAQNIVVEDTFDGNELSWTENGKPGLGENIIIDGKFKFDSKNSYFLNNVSRTPNLLLSEGVMPIDPAQGFSVSVDMEFDHIGTFLGIPMDNINVTSGILLEYDDDLNFIAVAVNEKACYILIYKEGQLTRYKVASVKMKGVNKNKVNANLKIDYHDYKLKIYVDDIEMTEMRKISIESPVIALFTTGKRKVSFDNVVISQ